MKNRTEDAPGRGPAYGEDGEPPAVAEAKLHALNVGQVKPVLFEEGHDLTDGTNLEKVLVGEIAQEANAYCRDDADEPSEVRSLQLLVDYADERNGRYGAHALADGEGDEAILERRSDERRGGNET